LIVHVGSAAKVNAGVAKACSGEHVLPSVSVWNAPGYLANEHLSCDCGQEHYQQGERHEQFAAFVKFIREKCAGEVLC
jgi:hypothetical protein